MKTTIEMVLEAGFWQEHTNTWMCNTKDIEHLIELVRADEREQGQKWFDAVTAQHKQEILAELEACAKVCEKAIASIWEYSPEDVKQTGTNVCNNLAAAIRARAKHD